MTKTIYRLSLEWPHNKSGEDSSKMIWNEKKFPSKLIWR